MDIRNRKELKAFAAGRLEGHGSAGRIAAIYAGLVLALAGAATVGSYLLQLRIGQSGGLGNLGARTVLTTVQSVLPLIQAVLALCLDLGLLAAMLRVARGQFVSPQTLRLGFDRARPLLVLTVLRGLMMVAMAFVCLYLATMIFMVTPLSNDVMALLLPLVQNTSATYADILSDQVLYERLSAAMAPMMAIFGVLFAGGVLLVLFPYRLAEYVLIDRPDLGALAALRLSRRMLRRSKGALLKLDLSFWWYYAALALALSVCYGDQLLPALGVSLPMSAGTAYLVFYGVYLALQFGVYVFLRPRVEVTYALVYDALKPPEPQKGAVLGNIFRM